MDSSLFRALASGDIDGLKQLIISDSDVLLQTTTTKNTSLHIAVQFNTICVEEICKRCPMMLLEQNMEGSTPLHVGSRLGFDGVVTYLIQHAQVHHNNLEKGLGGGGSSIVEGPSSTPSTTLLQQLVRMANKENDTALHEALRNGRFPVVQLLLGADPTFEYFANNAGESPLYLAIKAGFSHDVVSWILENCPSCAHGGPGGKTALHATALLKQGSVIRKVLLEKKPHILKEVDEFECSALHYAAFCGNVDMILELLGVDRSLAYMLDKDGKTVLHHAASNIAINQNHVQVIDTVTQCCPDCWELLDNNGQNFLHVAAENGRTDVINYVLGVKSKMVEQFINKKDKDGRTPFRLVLESGSGDGWRAFVADKRVDTRPIHKTDEFTAYHVAQNALIPMPDTSRTDNYIAKYEKETLDLIERMNENHMVVAALIATVSFAAGFTLPGGYNSDGPHKGSAVLKDKPAFMIFIVFDTIAMILSIFSLFIIFWSNFIRKDRQAKLETLALVTLFCTIASLVAMVVSFVTGTYVVLSDSPGLAIPLCVLGCSFFPLCVFLVRTIFKWESAPKQL